MRYMRNTMLPCLAVMAACSWRRTPVPVISDSGSTTALVGEWTGEYSSTQTGRSGSITFQLAGESTDFGHVPAEGRWKVTRNTSRATTPEG